MRNQFVRTMNELGAENTRIVAVLGDISVFAMRTFQEQFPTRFYNIGICEQAMLSIAAGLSAQGWIPVIHTIAPFLVERAYEQIKDDLCYQGLGANLVSVGAAFDYSPDGPTHHCWGDFGILRVLPGMEIVSPGSPQEFDWLFRETYANGQPTYFRLATAQHGVAIPREQIRFGTACLLKEGRRLTVIVAGPRLKAVLEAAAIQDVEVVYIHTIKPLDAEAVRRSARRTGNVLCVEEHSVINGLGAAVAEVLEDLPGVRLRRHGIPHQFLSTYGTYEENLKALRLDATGIAQVIEECLR